MTLGEVIKSRRTDLGFSQEILGEKIGKQDSFISRIERGSEIQLSMLVKLANALDMSLADLLVSAGYMEQAIGDVLQQKDAGYLTKEDLCYIRLFANALIEKRKGENGA